MQVHELGVIIDGDLDEPVAQRWIKVVNDQVKAAGGQTIGHPEWWGKRRFAYEINKKEEGFYVFFNVAAPAACSASWSATCACGRGRPPQASPPARPRGRTPRHGRAGQLKGRPPWQTAPSPSRQPHCDPELRFTQSGQAIATLGIVVSRRYQQNGEWQEKTSFFNITAWGQPGENGLIPCRRIAHHRHRSVGAALHETQDGEKRSVVEVVADEIGPSLRWATAQVDRNDRRERRRLRWRPELQQWGRRLPSPGRRQRRRALLRGPDPCRR